MDDRLTIKLGVVIQKVRHEDWSVFQPEMIITATASGKIALKLCRAESRDDYQSNTEKGSGQIQTTTDREFVIFPDE